LEAESQLGRPSCSAGIERMNGASNSWATWKAANSASGLWQDPEFTADTSSLYWAGYPTRKSSTSNIVGWKRPSEMGGTWAAEGITLFGKAGKPQPNGIKQTGLSDCWFLASVASVAEDPSRILDIMANRQYSTHGIFRFKFWVVDKWVHVNVDDRLPVRSWGAAFRPWSTWRSTQGAWWMPLLEKAYAKLDLNYDRIAWGNGIEGLRTLTGMPSNFLRH